MVSHQLSFVNSDEQLFLVLVSGTRKIPQIHATVQGLRQAIRQDKGSLGGIVSDIDSDTLHQLTVEDAIVDGGRHRRYIDCEGAALSHYLSSKNDGRGLRRYIDCEDEGNFTI